MTTSNVKKLFYGTCRTPVPIAAYRANCISRLSLTSFVASQPIGHCDHFAVRFCPLLLRVTMMAICAFPQCTVFCHSTGPKSEWLDESAAIFVNLIAPFYRDSRGAREGGRGRFDSLHKTLFRAAAAVAMTVTGSLLLWQSAFLPIPFSSSF